MILLDTNVLSELMKTDRSEQVVDWINEKPIQSLFITAITQAEVLYGISLLPNGKRKTGIKKAAKALFSSDFSGRILSFDSSSTYNFATIAAERRKSGQPISQFDAQIAAIARTWGCTLATRNVRDFNGCGIDVVNPWEK